ncbi:putative non-specific serine/threonine protein kinase [Helianthus annuus]|nr:putative non-specific serine/threonine protein kinase [Helianthus annuus]KAJ0750655.1 putative non-specific serine/threonine protein kinase [Helianthus annuus]
MAATFHVLLYHHITFFLFFFFFPIHGLIPGSSLSVENTDDILLSPNRLFTAGFHKVGDNAYCFAIWFSDHPSTVVWMANRDEPVNGKHSKFSLQKDGNLVLTDAGRYIIWSTQIRLNSSSIKLQLYNTGNLILHEHENPVWQSFDYPTDTLLPNQLLTKNTQLVSSRSSTNYSSGFYRLFFDTDSILRLCYDSHKTTTVFWPDPGLLSWQVGRYQYLYSERASLDSEGRFNSTDGLGFLSADFGYGPQRMMKIDMDGNLRVYSLVENGATREWMVQWQAISHSCRIHGVCGQNSLCTYSQDSGRTCTCLHGYKMVNSKDWSYGCEPDFQICRPEDEDFVELRYVEFYGYDIRYC